MEDWIYAINLLSLVIGIGLAMSGFLGIYRAAKAAPELAVSSRSTTLFAGSAVVILAPICLGIA